MRKLIFNAFAFKEEFKNSPQLGGKVSSKTIDTYMKNIYVSLKSAKVYNPQDDVALITNSKIPKQYADLFAKNNIQLFVIPFEDFVMPAKFVWALAFFKLCALKYVVENLDYEKYLLIDADTVTVAAYNELWQECEYGLMLYNVGHSIGHRERQFIIRDYEKLYPLENKNIIHYGGEFVAGTRENLKIFMQRAEGVYNKICENDYNVADNIGDETITSIVASHMENIVPAHPYICRYWTGRFYLVSTNHKYNPVVIWHIPNEKENGFLKIFDYLLKKNKLPSNEKMARILGLPNTKRIFYGCYVIKAGIKKILG